MSFGKKLLKYKVRMNVDSSVFVFRRSNDEPVLFAYKRIDSMYLACVFSQSQRYTFLCSFAEILDVIPISAIRIHSHLTLKDTLEATLHDWKFEINLRLNTYGEIKMNFNARSPPRRNLEEQRLPSHNLVDI